MIKDTKLTQDEYFLQAATRGDFITVEAMVRQKEVDVNCTDLIGTTALTRASERGDERMTAYLLEMGANPNQKAHATGETALLNATHNNHQKIVDILLDNNAKVDEADNHGKTPLLAAILTNNQILANRLVSAGADLNKQNIWGQTALHLAVQKNNHNLTKFLLSKGSKTDITDEKGQTPLHLAVLAKDTKTAALLINFGAKVDVQDKKGTTPIELAVKNKDIDMFELLIVAKAQANNTVTLIKNELEENPTYQMLNITQNKEKFITSQKAHLIKSKFLKTERIKD